jgi:formylglycine-generating enzyme required for sulfatase activity
MSYPQYVNGLAIVFFGICAGVSPAANIQVTNMTLTTGAPAGEVYVQSDISWDASWRASWVQGPNTWTNWDAAWVFVKYRVQGAPGWSHATLSTNDSDHTAPAGSIIDVGVTGTNGMGLFLYRTAEGSGSWTNTGVKLRWLYAADGVAGTAQVDVAVHATEMVYVPEGSFELGDGVGSGTFYEGGGGTSPFLVTNAGPITCGNVAGQLWGAAQAGNNSMGGAGTISSAYPNGYSAFYCMKHEISQGQYADFLKQLTSGDATNRAYTGGANRHTIGGSWPNYTSVVDRACNQLSWADGAAYADWSGLRPMTELEFEKACRGPLSSAAGEYAWGNTTIEDITGFTGTDGSGTETASSASANVNYGNNATYQGPVRCGIFATASSTRTNSGATYWGIMEMSGNVWERPVTVGRAKGRGFTGLHGDGELSGGSANVGNWPGDDAVGAGRRGGSWNDTSDKLRASDRNNAAVTHSGRNKKHGFRAVRLAPPPSGGGGTPPAAGVRHYGGSYDGYAKSIVEDVRISLSGLVIVIR